MPSNPSLGDLLAELLDDTPDVNVSADREYSHARVAFAQRTGEEVIELRLGAEIGEAALRTPDTQPSKRGDDWIRFAPKSWDDMAVDRLHAWFRLAWKLAGPERS